MADALNGEVEEKVAVAALVHHPRQPAAVVVEAVVTVVGQGVVLGTKWLVGAGE